MAVNQEPTNDGSVRGEGPADDVLERASRLLRDRPPDDWTEVSHGIRERLASSVVPAQTFAAHVVVGERGSSIAVSSRVLLPALRQRLESDAHVADRIDLVAAAASRTGGHRRLGTVRVELVCRYGVDLLREGELACRTVAQVVREVLGDDPDFDPERDVRAHVVDVVGGDPREG